MNTKRIEMITYGVAGDRLAPHKLKECIAEFSTVLAAIPVEYQDSAEISFDPMWYHGESYGQVQIDYERPMTPEEQAAFGERERQHWLEQLETAKERVAHCERELAAIPTAQEQAAA